MPCKCLRWLFGKKRPEVPRPITLSPAGGRKPVVLTPVSPLPTPGDTFANTLAVFANANGFRELLLGLEMQIVALEG